MALTSKWSRKVFCLPALTCLYNPPLLFVYIQVNTGFIFFWNMLEDFCSIVLDISITPPSNPKPKLLSLSLIYYCNVIYMYFIYNCFQKYTLCVCVFSSHLLWTSSSLDVPAGVTQEEGHTGFLIHLLSAVRALTFLARRIQPFLSLVDREVEFCILTI